MKARIVLLFLGFMAVWTGLLLRAAYLQVLPNQRLEDLKRRQFDGAVTLQPRRGDITDRNGRELAISVPAYSLFADPKLIEKPRRVSDRLARILGKNPGIIYSKIKSKDRRFVWIERRLTEPTKIEIERLNEPGLAFVEETRRIYPNETLAAQTLGFVGQEGGGLEGVELKWDPELRGAAKKVNYQRDARGRPLVVNGQMFTERPGGAALTLTLDAELQYELEQELALAVHQYKADGAVGVIMDPQTSDILAMGSFPTFNLNLPSGSEVESRRNRTITDPIEPGSTMKTFAIAAAIEAEKVAPNTLIDCENGQFQIGKRVIHEADSKHRFSKLTVQEILQKSSNVGSSKIALMLGDKSLRDAMVRFGFGEKSGVELAGESRGVLPELPWNDHLLANVSFGHGVSATPLQVATAYSAIVNGGVFRRPRLVKALRESDDEEPKEQEIDAGRRILSEKTASVLRLMLVGTTQADGTGYKARISGFPVGGKTGTAQKARRDAKGYEAGAYISSFAGFVPAHDPRFVIYIAIDNPKGAYYGSDVAAPVFSRLGTFALRKTSAKPVLFSMEDTKSLSTEAFFTGGSERENPVVTPDKTKSVTAAWKAQVVPEFKGLTLREVLRELRPTSLEYTLIGQGFVEKTEPPAGAPLPSDRKLQVFLSTEESNSN